jgi:hypothetical protein
MRVPDAQVDIQLAGATALAGLEFSKRASNGEHLIVSYFVTEKVRWTRLRLKCLLRTRQFRLHGRQDSGGFGVLRFDDRRKKREQNGSSNLYSQG